MSPTPLAAFAAQVAATPVYPHVVKRAAAAGVTTTHATLRQQAANRDFASAYQYIIVGCVALLALRNVCRLVARHNRAWRLALQKLDALQMERLGEQKEGYEALGHRATWSAKVDAVVFYPLRSRWALRLENPLQVLIVVASVAVNVGFVLVRRPNFFLSVPGPHCVRCTRRASR